MAVDRLTYSDGETCTLDVAEFSNPGNTVTEFRFSDFDGEVGITHIESP